MLHKIPLLLLKGCQDINIEKQVITPSVVRISDKTEDKFSGKISGKVEGKGRCFGEKTGGLAPPFQMWKKKLK